MPLVAAVILASIVVLGFSWLIYDSFKDRLPWRRNDGEHHGLHSMMIGKRTGGMNKQRIIDIGIIFVCITAILSGLILTAFYSLLVTSFIFWGIGILFFSSLTYDAFKDKLPWRRNHGEHHDK